VQRQRVRLDGNRPRTHPNRSGRKATKVRPASTKRCDCPEHGDVLARLSRSIALVETIAVEMQTREDDMARGSLPARLDLACRKLWRVHGSVDLALNQVPP
jgi:hypothetical protein